MQINSELQSLLEGKFVVLATITPDLRPNMIMVKVNKVIAGDTVLITDNFMKQTIQDIRSNDHVALMAWHDNLNHAYKLIGRVRYFTEGEYFEMLKPLNEGFPCKGALVIKVEKVIASV